MTCYREQHCNLILLERLRIVDMQMMLDGIVIWLSQMIISWMRLSCSRFANFFSDFNLIPGLKFLRGCVEVSFSPYLWIILRCLQQIQYVGSYYVGFDYSSYSRSLFWSVVFLLGKMGKNKKNRKTRKGRRSLHMYIFLLLVSTMNCFRSVSG